MPNTAVKPANAESTWGEAHWEDRKPLIKKKALANASAFLLFVVSGSWEMRGFLSDQGSLGIVGADLLRRPACNSDVHVMNDE